MHFTLPDGMKDYVKQKVESGFYANEAEVVRDAIRRMKEEDDRDLSGIRAELAKGLKQADNGELEEYTPELLEQITAEALQNSKKKKHG